VAAGNVPAFDLDAPIMIQLVGCENVLWEDVRFFLFFL
jgi:polygalacturonase